jgi:multidrug efflux pump subunit AcrA (membrane-fusion protein)
MKKNFKVIIGIIVAIIIILAIYMIFGKTTASEYITVKPKYGDFISSIKTTGELRAKNSIDIRAPDNARVVGIYQMKIADLVEEGKLVKTGDFVAELDKSEIMNKVKEIQLNIQKIESQLVQSQLDSSLSLSAARDELENLKFTMEEKKMVLEQSKFEAPSVIRQVELDYDRTKRSMEQSQKNFQTKVKQSIAKLSEINTEMMKEQQKLAQYTGTFDQFTIKAPADGMVIYAREWGGRRRTKGSQIEIWDPIVATLPDLSKMESVTFVNEVDIQKIKVNQYVNIGFDANPNKKNTGKVVKVTNIGEQRRGSNAKVFEVIVEVNEKDTTLLPSMTTVNEILIDKIQNKLSIPLECLHTEGKDNQKLKFVFKKKGTKTIKQEVTTGIMNENEIVIESGLTKEDDILMTIPVNPEKIELVKLSKKKDENKKSGL